MGTGHGHAVQALKRAKVVIYAGNPSVAVKATCPCCGHLVILHHTDGAYKCDNCKAYFQLPKRP
jgi:transposase